MKVEVTIIIDTGDTPLTLEDVRQHFFQQAQSLYEICDDKENGYIVDLSCTVRETT